MTEDEAKKILDFLFKRVERNYSTLGFKMTGIRKEKYNDLIVEFDIFIFHYRRYLFSDNEKENMIQLKKPGILNNIVECLFKEAKNCNIVFDDILSVNQYVPLVFKGESLEEVLVKADLEDFDDRG